MKKSLNKIAVGALLGCSMMLGMSSANAICVRDGNLAEFNGLHSGTCTWHFVHTKPGTESGTLTATIDGVTTVVANGEPQEANVLHYYVVAAGDLQVVASTTCDNVDNPNRTRGENLNISSVSCVDDKKDDDKKY